MLKIDKVYINSLKYLKLMKVLKNKLILHYILNCHNIKTFNKPAVHFFMYSIRVLKHCDFHGKNYKSLHNLMKDVKKMNVLKIN